MSIFLKIHSSFLSFKDQMDFLVGAIRTYLCNDRKRDDVNIYCLVGKK